MTGLKFSPDPCPRKIARVNTSHPETTGGPVPGGNEGVEVSKVLPEKQGQALGCRVLTWRARVLPSPSRTHTHTPEHSSGTWPIPELQKAFWKTVWLPRRGPGTEGALGTVCGSGTLRSHVPGMESPRGHLEKKLRRVPRFL